MKNSFLQKTSLKKVFAFLLTGSLILLSTKSFAASSGLPLPRFVSLRSAEINLRRGPGTQYPIDWVFVRAGLPVEIISEFETWRKVRDIEGAEGWVHQRMLSGKRTVMLHPFQEPVFLMKHPKHDSKPLAQVQGGAIGYLKKCTKRWCRVAFSNREGWLQRSQFWGIREDEVIK